MIVEGSKKKVTDLVYEAPIDIPLGNEGEENDEDNNDDTNDVNEEQKQNEMDIESGQHIINSDTTTEQKRFITDIGKSQYKSTDSVFNVNEDNESNQEPALKKKLKLGVILRLIFHQRKYQVTTTTTTTIETPR